MNLKYVAGDLKKTEKDLLGHDPPSLVRETHARDVAPRIDHARQNVPGNLKTTKGNVRLTIRAWTIRETGHTCMQCGAADRRPCTLKCERGSENEKKTYAQDPVHVFAWQTTQRWMVPQRAHSMRRWGFN